MTSSEELEILWDFETQAFYLIPVRRPYQLLINKKNEYAL